jgi:hypothetical protein
VPFVERDDTRPGDRTWRMCDPSALALLNRTALYGQPCEFWQHHKLQLPVLGGASSLDSGAPLRAQMLDYVFQLDIAVPGQALVALADRAREPRCPPAGWTEILGSGAAGDASSSAQTLELRVSPDRSSSLGVRGEQLLLQVVALSRLRQDPLYGTVLLGQEPLWTDEAGFAQPALDLTLDPRSQPPQAYVPCAARTAMGPSSSASPSSGSGSSASPSSGSGSSSSSTPSAGSGSSSSSSPSLGPSPSAVGPSGPGDPAGWRAVLNTLSPLSVQIPAYCPQLVVQLRARDGLLPGAEICWTYLVDASTLATRASSLADETTSANGGGRVVAPYSSTTAGAAPDDVELARLYGALDDSALRTLATAYAVHGTSLLELGDALLDVRPPPGGHAAQNTTERQRLRDALNAWAASQEAYSAESVAGATDHEEIVQRLYRGLRDSDARAALRARELWSLLARIKDNADDLDEIAALLNDQQAAIRAYFPEMDLLIQQLNNLTGVILATLNNTGDVAGGWAPYQTGTTNQGVPVYDLPSETGWRRFADLWKDLLGAIGSAGDSIKKILKCLRSPKRFADCVFKKGCRIGFIKIPCKVWTGIIVTLVVIGFLVLLTIAGVLYSKFRPNGTRGQRTQARSERKSAHAQHKAERQKRREERRLLKGGTAS